MIVALFANMNKHNYFSIAVEIRDFLTQRGVKVVARDEEAKNLQVPPLSSVSPKEIQFLISMGGDGTILKLVHHYPHLEAPILGINLGHLGFMADVPVSDLYPSLEDLLNGQYTIENRVMMEGKTKQEHQCFAVNDIVLHRSTNPGLIDLSIHVDGVYLNTFSADGIILSTANGSTAYSLAAGGPILTPNLEAFLITPICPHTISNRPIVLMPTEKIEVECIASDEAIEVTFDGFSLHKISQGEVLTVKKSDRTFKMVSLHRINYFSTLRTKLGWSGQVRYSRLKINER